jgi:hypothetical protein
MYTGGIKANFLMVIYVIESHGIGFNNGHGKFWKVDL